MTFTAKEEAGRIVRAIGNRWQKWSKSKYYEQLTVEETFTTIYQSRAWGSVPDRPFCSGDGSIREDAVAPYIRLVQQFMKDHRVSRLVDLGCGDFSVGSRLVHDGLHYTGVDIVPDLVRYNHENFSSPSIEFRCLDLLKGELPKGDICLVRQVLQHLSNEQILRALQSLRRYRHVLVTEHVYAGPGMRRNQDKPQGPGTRIPKRSGVFLESPPFGCPAQVLLEVPLEERESLRTVLIEFG